MSSGLSGNDIPDVSEYNNWFNAPNQLEYTLNLSVIHQPGEVFGYNTGASTFKITTNGIQAFGPGYGYFWWIGSGAFHGYYFANGYGGQFIVVVPDLRLIVVATNRWSNVATATANQQWYSTLDVIINRIVPTNERYGLWLPNYDGLVCMAVSTP